MSLAAVLAGTRRAGRARQFYLETWNGNGRFTYDRIGRGTVDIEACCLSVLGASKPARCKTISPPRPTMA